MLSEIQIEAFGELIHIGLKRAVLKLCHQANFVQTTSIPNVRIKNLENIKRDFFSSHNNSLFPFWIAFDGELTGFTEIIFPAGSELVLQTILIGDTSNSINPNLENTDLLNEFANIMINSFMGEISKILDTHFNYRLIKEPSTDIINALQGEPSENPFILFCESNFSMKNIPIGCNLFIVPNASTIKKLKAVFRKVRIIEMKLT